MARYHHDIVLPEVYNHKVEEERILKFWHKEKVFEKLKKSRREDNDGKFSFYSAPVPPTGHPHSGHILNSVIKDVLKRYGYQRNLRVESTFRWDSHCLFIEHEVDKKLGIKHLGDLQKTNVKSYNDECRSFVEERTAEWKPVFQRIGNCMDSTKEYSTSDASYMENVWRIFKLLYDKGMVYKDTKTRPYSPGCFTILSNFEAEQNLKEVVEVGTTIALNIVNSSEKFLIWTTTPWTLAFDSVICINPKARYVKVKAKEEVYILSKNSLEFVFKNPSEYTVVEEVLGESLANLNCEPLFQNVSLSSGYSVSFCDSFHNDVGTGIMASEDFMTEPLSNGHILNIKEVKHKKAHCWLSDTLLVNKRVQSWFIRTQGLMDDLLNNISQVRWLPDDILQEDFTNWLENSPADWPISRIRNWGTPLPIWSSPSGDEIICIGSIKELMALSGKTNIPDLHREVVDGIVIPSKTPGNPPLRRIPDVFDNSFESGALPFMWRGEQVDFVAEDIDQKRGFFYTTLVLATALSEPPPFRNVFAHGLTLEVNGSKVTKSKRKHHHNDPIRLCEKYGADALRLHLLSCSSSNFILEEEGVAKMAETVIKPLYRIFYKCTSQLGCPKWINYGYVTMDWYCLYLKQDPIDDWILSEGDLMDQWILSCTEALLKFYTEEMKAYRLNTFLPKLIKIIQLIDELYIPLRCPGLKQNSNRRKYQPAATHPSSPILFYVIYRICLILGPVAPFLTETIYQIHRKWIMHLIYYRYDSIHAAPLMEPREKLIKPDIELVVDRMQTIIKIVRELRVQHMIPMHYQIQEVIVIHHSKVYRKGVLLVEDMIKKLLNARDMRVSPYYREFGASMRAHLKDITPTKQKQTTFENLTEEQIQSILRGVDLEHGIAWQDIGVSYDIPEQVGTRYAIVSKEDLIVVMNMNKDLFFYEDGTVKELIKQIGIVKKKANFYPSDIMTILYTTEDECLENVIAKYGKQIYQSVKCDLRLKEDTDIEGGHLERQINIKGAVVKLYFVIKSE